MAVQDANTGSILNKNDINNQKRFLEENKLHKYASYNYVFTLSALTAEELANPDKILKNSPHHVIARTGGIGAENTSAFNLSARKSSVDTVADDALIIKNKDTGIDKSISEIFTNVEKSNEILKKNRDIFFERVSIDSYPRPNQDRKLMNFTRIEMTLSEPMGISFWEKCRAAAAASGYLNHVTAPYLLKLEFKGYDSNGKELPNEIAPRFYPIRLTQSELQLNAGGSTYSVTAQPWTEFGMVNTFLYTRGSGTVKGSGKKLSTYLEDFALKLNKINEEEVDNGYRQYPDNYVITADPSIGDVADYENDLLSVIKDFLGFKNVDFGPKNSIAKIIEDIVKQNPRYRKIDKIIQQYWKDRNEAARYDDNTIPEPWVPWFKIVTTVTLDNKRFDEKLKSHPATIHYHVVPYKIHILNFARAGLGGAASWGRYVKKKFDYIFTGENFDVLDLNITYRAGYYRTRLKSVVSGKTLQKAIQKFQEFFGIYGVGSTFPEPNLPLSEAVGVVQSSTPNNLILGDESQVQEFYDYLTNPTGDMVNVDMQVMGDPAFLGQDFALPMKPPVTSGTYTRVSSLKGQEYDPQTGVFNFDNAEPLIQLNFRFPTDINENTGLYEFKSEVTPQFTGLYRVNRVESIFEAGKFTQNLQMSRFNNQNAKNYTGASAIVYSKITGESAEGEVDVDQRGGNFGEGGA